MPEPQFWSTFKAQRSRKESVNEGLRLSDKRVDPFSSAGKEESGDWKKEALLGTLVRLFDMSDPGTSIF